VEVDAALAVNGGVARGGPWVALTGKLAGAVAAASAQARLAPGDAVGVATFEAAGDDASPGASPGDEVVLEATGLGALRAFVAPALRAASGTER
jgi:2-keto-4-pentenoate hydratase/2-oxohepta-3-ene-1,7-dioic acid hydratase in catechol pathway